MKRFWLGLGLLLALLALGLGVQYRLSRHNTPVLEKLAEASVQEEAAALEFLRQAQAQWHRSWHGAAALTDHAPMEEIDTLFARALLGGEEFYGNVAELRVRIRSLTETHALRWWNLL